MVVDRLTKYAHFCALSHPFKANTFSTAFMETIQKLHGNPKIIVSDRDPIFSGNFWTELFSFLGTQLAHSSSYHPQSDGQTEIAKKCLEGYLRCFRDICLYGCSCRNTQSPTSKLLSLRC